MQTPGEACPEPSDVPVGQKAVELGLITERQLRDLLAQLTRTPDPGGGPPSVASALVRFGLLTQRQLDALGTDTAAVRKKFGKYTIVRQLGRGAMGVVFEAIDADLGRTVALKMLLNNPSGDAEEAARDEERFIREARLSASLPKHPGIVGVYESGILEGRRYIAMEYVEGCHFEDWCRKSTGSLRSQVSVLRDAAVAVDHAHRHGVVHRDLKPANVLVDIKGRPHVTDFGLAKQIRQDASLTLTGGGRVMGTPTYISPEQASGRKDVDRRTDIWALGIMLFELLAGRPPFRGETPVDVMMKIVKNPVPSPTAIARGSSLRSFDPAIEGICLKALSKEPRDRYPTAKLMANDLSRWLKGEAFDVAPPKKRAAPPVPWIVAGVVAVLAVALLFVVFSSSSGDKAQMLRKERAAAFVSQGERLLNQGKNADALFAFGQAFELDGENPSATAGKREAERRIAASRVAPAAVPVAAPASPVAPPPPTQPTPR
ncbi:MAG TPA: serine/threonine-protein kinase, partial [Planctomycetota bacterium]|nr:serine/threonine-protein kinase [Planctomycetota bacterium]